MLLFVTNIYDMVYVVQREKDRTLESFIFGTPARRTA